MKSIRTLAVAAAFAAGTSAFGLAEEAAPDSIVNYEPIFGTYSVAIPQAGYVPQTVTPFGLYAVPASPWIASRFTTDRTANVEENWFLRAEAVNTGSSSE